MKGHNMLKDKKLYMIIYGLYYEARFIREIPLYNHLQVTFRTREGDFFLTLDKNWENESHMHITDDFNKLKLEIGKLLYKGRDIKRLPLQAGKILWWAMQNHPEKLI